MNYQGFKGFAKPAKVDAKAVEEKIARSNVDNLYVLFTGGKYRARRGSGRATALQTITEVKKPISLGELYRRAAKAVGGDKGYTPDLVRSGLFLHAGAKPCVYWALEKREDGAFVAAKSIPYPDGHDKPIKEGDVVIAAGAKALPKPARKAKALAKPAE